MFQFTPKSMGVHLSLGKLEFVQTKFSREEIRTVIVCNETPHEVYISGEFYKDPKLGPVVSVESSSSGGEEDEEELSNKIIEDAVSMHSVLLYDFEEENNSQQVLYHPDASKHFDFVVPNRISGLISGEIKLIFRPHYDPNEPFPEDMEPPYFQRTRVNFCVTDAEECYESHFIVLSGEIGGIEVETHPKVIDFRKVYLGEEHCAQIKILNVDGKWHILRKYNNHPFQLCPHGWCTRTAWSRIWPE